MSLCIKDISLKNFRNYSEFELSNIGPLTIFFGRNAIGKTNIIEAAQLVTSLSSLKNAHATQLVHWDEDFGSISALIGDEIRSLSVRMDIKEEKKHYFLNDKKKRPKDIRGILSSVLFSPDDLSLIKGSQSLKRTTLDSLGGQLSSNYQVIRKDYEKILSHKNTLLKEECPRNLLESVNETLLTIGTQLYCYRNSVFQRLIPHIKNNYEVIAGQKEVMDASYIPSWENANSEIYQNFSCTKAQANEYLSQALHQKMNEEINRKRSLVGPHADKIEFYINKKNAGTYGSQGQQRSLVLSFKLAEVEVIEEITNQKPLLLLDDVMSELDTERRILLMDFIQDDIQTFITTTHLEYFTPQILNQANVIDLEKR